jgi:hypothetical protein
VRFAYYQSSLVVEYLVDKFGFPSASHSARSANGVDINDAIAKHTAPMKQIEEFAAFAKRLKLGPD